MLRGIFNFKIERERRIFVPLLSDRFLLLVKMRRFTLGKEKTHHNENPVKINFCRFCFVAHAYFCFEMD